MISKAVAPFGSMASAIYTDPPHHGPWRGKLLAMHSARETMGASDQKALKVI